MGTTKSSHSFGGGAAVSGRFRSQHKPVVAAVYAMDYERQHWIEAVRAHYVHSESCRSPMGGNIAAFVSRAAAELHGAVLRYDQLPEE